MLQCLISLDNHPRAGAIVKERQRLTPILSYFAWQLVVWSRQVVEDQEHKPTSSLVIMTFILDLSPLINSSVIKFDQMLFFRPVFRWLGPNLTIRCFFPNSWRCHVVMHSLCLVIGPDFWPVSWQKQTISERRKSWTLCQILVTGSRFWLHMTVWWRPFWWLWLSTSSSGRCIAPWSCGSVLKHGINGAIRPSKILSTSFLSESCWG